MCMFCKNKTYTETTTTHVVNYKSCIIIFRNVPCENVQRSETDKIITEIEGKSDDQT